MPWKTRWDVRGRDPSPPCPAPLLVGLETQGPRSRSGPFPASHAHPHLPLPSLRPASHNPSTHTACPASPHLLLLERLLSGPFEQILLSKIINWPCLFPLTVASPVSRPLPASGSSHLCPSLLGRSTGEAGKTLGSVRNYFCQPPRSSPQRQHTTCFFCLPETTHVDTSHYAHKNSLPPPPYKQLYVYIIHTILHHAFFYLIALFYLIISFGEGFPSGSVVKNLPANAGNSGSIPGSGRSPGEGNGYTLLYSCLGNLMDRGAWRAIVHRVAKESDTT